MNVYDDILGEPRSFEQIESIAIAFRKNYGLRPNDRVNIVDFVDQQFCQDFPQFAMIPVSVEEMGSDKARAEYSPICIKCREDVYLAASLGKGNSAEIIAHELGHIVLHERVLSKPLRNDGQMRFNLVNAKDRSTETQADQFAVAFIIPRVVAIKYKNQLLLEKELGISPEFASLALKLYRVNPARLMPYQRMDLECWEET